MRVMRRHPLQTPTLLFFLVPASFFHLLQIVASTDDPESHPESHQMTSSVYYAFSSNEIPHVVKGMRGIASPNSSILAGDNPQDCRGRRGCGRADDGALFRLLSYMLISAIGAMGSIFIISALTVVSVFQHRGNSYLASLCVGHLIVSCFVLPATAIAIMAGSPDSLILCHFQWLATQFMLLIHVLSFLMISIDCWKGLGKAYKYIDCCTKFRIAGIIMLIFMAALALILSQHYNDYAPNVCRSLSLKHFSMSSSTSSSLLLPASPPSSRPNSSVIRQQQPDNASILSSYWQSDSSSLAASPSPQPYFPVGHQANVNMTYHSIVGIGFIVVPTLLTVIFFSHSFLIVKNYKKATSVNPLNATFFLTDHNLLKSHIVVYALSVVMLTPICVTAVVDQLNDSLDPSLIDSSWYIALGYSCSFSFVYAFTNRDFGESFLQLFYYCCCKSHVNWSRKTNAGGLNQMAAGRTQSVPAVSVSNHHHHNYQTSTSPAAGPSLRPHGTGMGMVALGGGVSGGGICGGGPFRAFRQGRNATDL